MMKRLKNRNMILLLISATLLIGLLSGCSSVTTETGFIDITPEEAKERIDTEKDIILLDVRTKEEYDRGHIKGSMLIPVDTLKEEAEDKLNDKDATLFVYCRSGNRSTTASKILIELGYKNVYNLGGINSWPYEVVK